jgi:hypothetical protein
VIAPRHRGREARQRPAKARTAVRVRPVPPLFEVPHGQPWKALYYVGFLIVMNLAWVALVFGIWAIVRLVH